MMIWVSWCFCVCFIWTHSCDCVQLLGRSKVAALLYGAVNPAGGWKSWILGLHLQQGRLSSPDKHLGQHFSNADLEAKWPLKE